MRIDLQLKMKLKLAPKLVLYKGLVLIFLKLKLKLIIQYLIFLTGVKPFVSLRKKIQEIF
jgi:hypothetical protein